MFPDTTQIVVRHADRHSSLPGQALSKSFDYKFTHFSRHRKIPCPSNLIRFGIYNPISSDPCPILQTSSKPCPILVLATPPTLFFLTNHHLHFRYSRPRFCILLILPLKYQVSRCDPDATATGLIPTVLEHKRRSAKGTERLLCVIIRISISQAASRPAKPESFSLR